LSLPRLLPIFTFIPIACFSALAQPAFDVASVKPSAPVPVGQNLNINLGSDHHGTVTLANTTLSECIRYAYGPASEDQISGPDWIRDRELRFDIIAKAPPETPADQLLLMMRSLLAERFHLVLHTEQKPVAHLELSLAKTAPKLHESKEEGDSVLRGYGRGLLYYDRLDFHALVMLMSRQLRQPVIDKTGITGRYDVKLEWTPDELQPATDPANAPVRPDISIYTAVREQLGLQLETKKTHIEVLVVDHADKVPTPN
jgi:uncharacterized protein (TIGR03435 family)